MAKPETPAGSDKAEMKKWLHKADSKAIHVAFAFGADGKAVVKMDGIKQGPQLVKHLKDAMPDAKNHRFGTVMIDPDNPDTVKFMMNKAVSGAAPKLRMALKGTGFKKVQIVMDDGTVEVDEDKDGEEGGGEIDVSFGGAENDDSGDAGSKKKHASADEEEDDNEAEDEDETADARGKKKHASGDDADDDKDDDTDDDKDEATGRKSDADADDDDGKKAGGKQDAGALTKQLTDLVKEMMGAIKKDPTQKAALTEMATDAQASIKRGDLDEAAAGLEVFKMAISDAGSNGAGANGAGANGAAAGAHAGAPNGAGHAGDDKAAIQKIEKSRAVWSGTRSKIEGDLQKLNKAVLAAAKKDDKAEDLDDLLKSVIEPVLERLDESLSHTLDQAAKAKDSGERQKLMKHAQSTVANYQQYVTGNKILAHLDSNPYVQLNVVKTLTATLAALEKSIA